MSRTLRDAVFFWETSCAVPKKIFSSDVPSCSPTSAWACPSPAAVRVPQRVAGVSEPPVRKKTGRPSAVRHSATGSQAQPWAETSFQSCQGRPTAAASSWTLERPGRTRQEMPQARSMGSSPEAPE